MSDRQWRQSQVKSGGYFFPILQHKVGGLSPSPESGGPIPLSPLLRRLWRQVRGEIDLVENDSENQQQLRNTTTLSDVR